MRSFRTLAIIAFSLALVVGLSADVMARGRGRGRPDSAGPPESVGRPDFAGPGAKATGGIEVQREGNTAWVEFNAHEGDADHPGRGRQQAKGEFSWYLGGMEDPTREIHVDVRYVKVDGNEAWFAGEAVVDTNNGALEGRWFVVQVLDGGTPARRGDRVWWQWLPVETEDFDPEAEAAGMVGDMETPANEKEIVSGNLVVH